MNRLPPAAENLFHEATRLLHAGDTALAEARLRAALELAPGLAEAHANLGWLLAASGRDQEAERHYLEALELAPLQPLIHLNFGAFLAGRKRFAAAESAYRSALALDPNAPAAWSNLGVLLASVKREGEAERCYRSALLQAPDYRKARFNLAYLLLRQARFEEGWACLEARELEASLAARLDGRPRWHGEPLAGKSLLIGYEGGLGDMIQFCRYAALARERGAARVTVLCHPPLKRLLSGLRGIDRAIAWDETPAGDWDCWTLPLSLPHLFGTRLDTIPAALPYLSAEPALVRRWADLIGPPRQGELRVGLAWRGNPNFENDAERSLPSPAALAPLAALRGVRFFSLQKEIGADEAAAFPSQSPLCDLGSGFADFADSAAAVMNLDLVIAVDTALVHLAGALGKPCWVLLPDYKPDWRWLAGRADSPWYPGTMRLFRQPAAGDWATPVAAVQAALREFLERARA